jgi:hypothetical protein
MLEPAAGAVLPKKRTRLNSGARKNELQGVRIGKLPEVKA